MFEFLVFGKWILCRHYYRLSCFLSHCKSLNSIYLLFTSPNVEYAAFICGQEECVIHKVSFNP